MDVYSIKRSNTSNFNDADILVSWITSFLIWVLHRVLLLILKKYRITFNIILYIDIMSVLLAWEHRGEAHGY